MKKKNPPPLKAQWTVARLVALLSGVSRKATLKDVQKRFGIGLTEINRLNRDLLGTLDNTGQTGDAPLTIQLDGSRDGSRVVFSTVPAIWEKIGVLNREEASICRRSLLLLSASERMKRILTALAERMKADPEAAGWGVEDPIMFFGEPPDAAVSENLKTLLEARDVGNPVAFKYIGGTHDHSCVGILSLRRDNGVWRLLGWDEGLKEVRLFRVGKMRDVKKLDRPFAWPKHLDAVHLQAKDLSVYHPHGGEQEVKMKMRSSLFPLYQGMFPGVRVNPKPDRWVSLKLLANDPDWIAQIFLPSFKGVEIQSPVKFAQAWKNELEAVKALYRR